METQNLAVDRVCREPGETPSRSFNSLTGSGIRNGLPSSPHYYSPTFRNGSPLTIQGYVRGKRQYSNIGYNNRGRGLYKRWVSNNNARFHHFAPRYPVGKFGSSPVETNLFRRGRWIQVPTPEGKWYYYHEHTRETTWSQPVGDGVSISLSPQFYDGDSTYQNESVNPVNIVQSPMTPNGEIHLPAFCSISPFPMLPHDSMNMPSPLHFPMYQCSPPPWHVPYSVPPLQPMQGTKPVSPSNPLPPLKPVSPPKPLLPPQPASPLKPLPPPQPVSPPKPLPPPIPVSPLKPLKQKWVKRVSSLRGKTYYYNLETGVSSWEDPNKDESKVNSSVVVVAAKSNALDKPNSEAIPNAASSMKPVYYRSIKGTQWCVVLTNDHRMFYYDSSRKKSDWKRPVDLLESAEVDDFIDKIKSGQHDLSKLKNNDEEKTSSKSQSQAICTETNDKNEICTETNDDVEPNSILDCKIPVNNFSNVSKGTSNSIKTNIKGCPEGQTLKSKSSSDQKETAASDENKSSNNLQSEQQNLPLHERIQIFRTLLIEKEVSAFSRWEKELHKIVFDSRYCLLDSEMRKIVYQSFVAEEVATKHRKKREQQTMLEEEFQNFVKDVLSKHKLSSFTFEKFEDVYKNESNLQLIDNISKRKQLFKRVYKEALNQKRETVKTTDKLKKKGKCSREGRKTKRRKCTDCYDNVNKDRRSEEGEISSDSY